MRERTGLHLIVLVLALGSAGVFAAVAAGQGGEGSALDQYIENVPGSRGDKPTRDVIRRAGDPLPSAAQEALRELGPAGARAGRVAELITKRPRGRGAGRDDPPGGVGATLGELFDFDAEGLGFILPLILAAALIAGIAFALNRYLDKRELTP